MKLSFIYHFCSERLATQAYGPVFVLVIVCMLVSCLKISKCCEQATLCQGVAFFNKIGMQATGFTISGTV